MGAVEAAAMLGTDALERLAQRAGGDVAAFTELYVSHLEDVVRYLRARCRSNDEALTGWPTPITTWRR